MKFAKKNIISAFIILASTFASIMGSLNLKQVNIVQDLNGFHSDIQHVVRRSPTIGPSVITQVGFNRIQPPSDVVYASNSNTSNGPNVGFLGKSAEIVGKN
jgi:hypothetical protein